MQREPVFWYNTYVEVPSDQKEIAAAQRREFDDLQNEIAGRETGRRARFLKDGPGSEAEKKKEREAQHRALTRLAQLLNDPVYRAKYDGVLRLLSDAERATEAAIDQLNSQIDAAQSELDDMMGNAARLPDGTRVFRDADGVVRREDGSVVEDHLAETIIWTGNEPSFEDVQDAKARLDDLQAALDAAHGYQNDVLGPARDSITDPDNPPSLDDLDDIENDIRSKMPKVVHEHMPQTDAAAPEIATQSIGLPKLGG
ncbi:hypothetical protein [uncultured Roseobacter sp.]|uniref:hypothetical protein n=1 Tax=uncultured Roseobacter sp. TaxID=114847 RepID=UPI00262FBBF0|nr:hypothetical protein [uncultured Roseobacter sp.]